MKMLFIVPLGIFVASCARNIQLQTDVCSSVVCQPIYGRAEDWDIISDDLARNIYRHNKICEEYKNKN